MAKFDLTVVYVPGWLNTVADCLSRWAHPASNGLADISMHGEEDERAEARRIIKLEERLEHGDAHCFVVMAHRAKRAPEEPIVALTRRETSVARERQVAREAGVLNTKAAPLKSRLAEDRGEDYAKSEYWATNWEASSKPESELAWPPGLCIDEGELFVFGKMLVPKARMARVVQEWHDQRLLHPADISDCSRPPYEESSWEGGDAEPGTPRPPNHVFCTVSRRQLMNALIANWPALAAILFYHCTTGARSHSRK